MVRTTRIASSISCSPETVAAAALKGVLSLVERGEVRDREKLRNALPGFLLTSTDFRPQFEMKLSYRRVLEALSRGQEAAR